MIEQANSPSKSNVWVEPTIQVLDVAETEASPLRGGDGATRYADCTRS
ncbi:hypothetical protein M9980_09990 [Sphingomonas donggukensis]|uniref:Paeninodin family lasso peptide n=1 Tax=Sphingomonas donggukensis TaxID=2949093 RepID=A0ABY4TR76_9SPHN|nr:hypothetical protein [Sphingomonas donggukensis]URW74894.1 hypothetical protein M9980_09990 [Sphingomonas donggukensis]